MKHEIYVVVDKNSGKFLKKYKYQGAFSSKGRLDLYPDKINDSVFTDVLGRARIFESEKTALTSIPSWGEGRDWLSNGLVEVKKLICEKEEGV